MLFEVPCMVNGEAVCRCSLRPSSALHDVPNRLRPEFSENNPLPHDHTDYLCAYHDADEATVAKAIDGALAAKAEWEGTTPLLSS